MNAKDEALNMAIEVLSQDSKFFSDPREYVESWDKALNACKQALEQPAQEPVAWIKEVEVLYMKAYKADGIKNWKTNLGLEPEPDDVALYLHPAQPLSDDEILDMAIELMNKETRRVDFLHFGRAIEQAHGIGVKE